MDGSMYQVLPRVLAIALPLGLGGCAADGVGPAPRAAMPESACVNLVRDMRQYCREGIRDPHAATGIDCLSARLEYERRCQ